MKVPDERIAVIIAYEELKYGILQAVEEIETVKPGTENPDEYNSAVLHGTHWAVSVIKKHLSKYLESDE